MLYQRRSPTLPHRISLLPAILALTLAGCRGIDTFSGDGGAGTSEFQTSSGAIPDTRPANAHAAASGRTAILPGMAESPRFTSGSGALRLRVLWPSGPVAYHTAAIPYRTQLIKLAVTKDNKPLYQTLLGRPTEASGSLTSELNILLDAATGLAVRAEAFAQNPVATGDIPIATGVAGNVTLLANQRTDVALDLLPAAVPRLDNFAPRNGGPGVSVSLQGSFGEYGPYGISLNGVIGWASSAKASTITASIPPGASSSYLVALADGIPSNSGAIFRVLRQLDLSPVATVLTVGSTAAFTVPTARDTADQLVADPTLTGWEVVDPARLDLPGSPLSAVGTVSAGGLFTAQATGTAQVQVFSGYLLATATVTVQ